LTWPQILIFSAGLLIGLLCFPALRTLNTASVHDLLGAIGHAVSTPFFLAARLFGKKAEPRETGEAPPGPAVHKVDPREQQISDSAQAVRSILLILTSVIERTDQAASESSQALNKLRDSVDRTGLPPDVAAATSLLMEQIERMISNNTSLKGKLAGSQEILTVQQSQIDMLRTAVLLDGMTQLANRSYFDDKLAEMIKLWQRYGEIFFLMIIDVDNFKAINDTHGHQAGDRILKGVAFKIKSVVRESDFLARFGGDEFALILIKSTAHAAADVAGKLCSNVRDSRFLLDHVEIKVTLSIGAAQVTADDTVESLLRRADQALYRVKETGRDGVVFAYIPPGTAPPDTR
jgi:diguanylate cyclase